MPVAAPGCVSNVILSVDDTVSVFVVSSKSPVAEEPIDRVWFPLPPFFLSVNVDVAATEFADIFTNKLDRVPAERNFVSALAYVVPKTKCPPILIY